MNIRTLLCGFVFGAGTVLLANRVVSQDNGTPTLSDAERIEVLKKFAAIGQGHRPLGKVRGPYSQKVKLWRAAGDEPLESAGTAKSERILDGRFLTQTVRGKWLGKSFKGYAILGYDNASEQYMMAWMDTLSTRILTAHGPADKSGRKATLLGEYFDPITQRTIKIKSELRFLNKKGEIHLEVYDVTSPEQEHKFLEVKTKRQLPAAA